LKGGTTDTVASATQHISSRQLLTETSVASVGPETRVDIALLVSALFLQRFTLPFGNTFLGLGLLSFVLILFHQFVSGKLLIQYDRLLWFIAVGFAATWSLLSNFNSQMLTGYSQFLVFFGLFTLSRPSTPDKYMKTLQAFQFLVTLLSCLGVVQFVAQFVLDGISLINFYWIVPDLLTKNPSSYWGSDIRNFDGIIKSTGLFLTEPSALSQITALGILIEVLEFCRPRYLLLMALGFLVAYSGTGLMLLIIFLPLAGLRHGRAGLSALFVVVVILALFATGIIDLSVFTSRVGEFENTQSSGFARFVGPFWLAAKHIDTASLGALLLGSGPGTLKIFSDLWYAQCQINWFKWFYEYGIIGSFIFYGFLASCFRRSRCPGLVIAVIIFNYLFEDGPIEIAIALCTLNGTEPRRRPIDEEGSRYGTPLLAKWAGG
jgi:hypothetical protein